MFYTKLKRKETGSVAVMILGNGQEAGSKSGQNILHSRLRWLIHLFSKSFMGKHMVFSLRMPTGISEGNTNLYEST